MVDGVYDLNGVYLRLDTPNVEGNLLRDNARGVGLGLVTTGSGRTYADDACTADDGYVDHYGGVVRNNFVVAQDAGLVRGCRCRRPGGAPDKTNVAHHCARE